MTATPEISVVIAAYAPGEAFDRVIASLDAQTLPQEAFETIVVDDGSPDDTFERLTALAAARPNMRVERIENSGWPSRPRNVGTALARGGYVLYMDHDDTLYPDALRRLAEFAAETGADLVSPKESKTTDPWWNLPTLLAGNRADVKGAEGIAALLPMVPHKLYRRAFLAEHGITFPEGRRQLWEDIVVNVRAWAHAGAVAVLADTPVYLWHSSGGNNSKSYGPRDAEYWDRLADLLATVDGTLAGAGLEDDRRAVLLHQYQGRVLRRLSRSLAAATPEEAAAATARAVALQAQHVPVEWDLLLGPFDRARAALLRSGRTDLLAALAEADEGVRPEVAATSARWRDGALRLELEAQWCDREGRRVDFRREGDRVLRVLPPEVAEALPDDVQDVTDTIDAFRVVVGVRDRAGSVTWPIPTETTASWLDLSGGRVVPFVRGTAVLDPGTAAAGRAIGSAVHDLVAGVEWNAADYVPVPVDYDLAAAPAVTGGRSAVAYASKKETLAVDLGGSLRNALADGGPAVGRVPGTLSALRLPLPRITVSGTASIPVAARLRRADGTSFELPGRLVAGPEGAAAEVGTTQKVPAGEYELAFRVGDQPFFGKRAVQVAGKALTVQPKPGSASAKPDRSPAGLLGAVRRRIAG